MSKRQGSSEEDCLRRLAQKGETFCACKGVAVRVWLLSRRGEAAPEEGDAPSVAGPWRRSSGEGEEGWRRIRRFLQRRNGSTCRWRGRSTRRHCLGLVVGGFFPHALTTDIFNFDKAHLNKNVGLALPR